MHDPTMEYAYAEAVEIVFPADADGNPVAYRRWNGEGDWVYETHTYSPGGIMEIGEIEIGASLASNTGITLDLSDPTDRALFLDIDPGPAPAKILEMWRKRSRPRAGGVPPPWPAWTVDGIYAGKLSTPRYSRESITIDIQRVYDDVWRGNALRWTATDQRRRYPGDSGLDRADRIRRTGLLVAST